jgi:ubiquinone/menaquinone biosynthesis C-methylase UbiE
MNNPSLNGVTQKQVTDFYNQMIFFPKTDHNAYVSLVPHDFKSLKVADFGCGQSIFIDTFRERGLDAIFLDSAPKVLERIDYGRKILASLTQIPLLDNYIGTIFCINVVHHIPEINKAISEILRVLEKGGTLFLGVYAPNTPRAWLRKIYDVCPLSVGKNLIGHVTGILIWLKNRKNGLAFGGIEHHKRIDDLLRTPLVRYAGVDYYKKMIEKAGGKIEEVKRISCMNVLVVKKL